MTTSTGPIGNYVGKAQRTKRSRLARTLAARDRWRRENRRAARQHRTGARA